MHVRRNILIMSIDIMGLVCRILQLKKALGGANIFFLTGQSGAKTFFQVKNVLHRPGGTINFALALIKLRQFSRCMHFYSQRSTLMLTSVYLTCVLVVLSVHEVHDGSVWWNTLAREKVVSEGHRGEQGEREVANVNRQQRNAREVYHLKRR